MSSRNNPFFVNPYSQHAQYSGSSCKSSVQGFTSTIPCGKKTHRGLTDFENWNFLPAG